MAIVYERPVRFEEVDAAGIVFFARFLVYCHESMERLFDELPRGYADLIMKRRIGFPAVHVSADWKSPLRFGDVMRIETSVTKIGTTSATLHYAFTNLATGAAVATIDHVIVSTHLESMEKIPLPDDCRGVLVAHAD